MTTADCRCTRRETCATCRIVFLLDHDEHDEAAELAHDESMSVPTFLRLVREVREARERHDRAAELVRALREQAAANHVDNGTVAGAVWS